MENLNASPRNNGSGEANDWSAALAYVAPLYIYGLPITATIGIILNIVMVAILRVPSPKCEITVIYVKAIAISDLGFLVFSLFPWLQRVFQINVYHRVGFCQLVNFAMTAFPSLSLFFTMCFVINGVIWKARPWIRQDLPEAFGTKAILCAIAFFSVYLHAYPVWFWESSTETFNQCTVHYKNARYFTAFLQFDLFKNILIQMALIAVAVAYGVCGGKWDNTAVPTSTPTSMTSFSAHSGSTHDMYGSDFRRLVLTFVVLVVLCKLPSSAVVLASLYFPTASQIWPHLIAFLFHIHFALKPLGYTVVSAEFRGMIKVSKPQCVETILTDAGEESERLHSKD